MKMRRAARAVLAVLTAYAMALQVILLAGACPLIRDAAIAAQPICSHPGSGGSAPLPMGDCCGCLGVCHAGACAAPVQPSQFVAIAYSPEPAWPLSVRPDRPLPGYSTTGTANRSRAPPLG